MFSNRVAKLAAKALWLACCAGFLTAATAPADRGQIVVRAKADVKVSSEAQNAIVAWDGQRELLVLSTALSATGEATVLEFLPLPAAPTRVEKAPEGIFDAVERLIADHAPVRRTPPPRTRGMGVGPKTEAPALVQIVRHERIGAHDITVAKATDAQALVKWAGRYVSGLGIQMDSQAEERLQSAASDYIQRGFGYFVFDVVKLTRRAKSVEPIAYQFPSKSLYFPLRVTRLAAGETSINLFLITAGKPDPAAGGTRLSIGVYQWGDDSGGSARKTEPIALAVNHDDLLAVDTGIASMFPRHAWFTAAHYEGPTNALERDLVIANLAKDPPPSSGLPAHSRALERQTRLMDAALSPDGRTLCVEVADIELLKPAPPGFRISLVPCSGGRMLTLPFRGYASPQCWSPDSKRICLAVSTPTARNICVVEAKTGRTTQLTRFSAPRPAFSDVGAPAWEPKGNRIAFLSHNNLWMVNADGSNLRRLTSHSQGAPPGDMSRRLDALWSPDGARIAYWHCLSPQGPPKWEPMIYDFHSNRSISLASRLPAAAYPGRLSWETSGGWLALRYYPQNGRRDETWVVRRDGSGARELAGGRSSEMKGPFWIPGGSWVLISNRENAFREIPERTQYRTKRVEAATGQMVYFRPTHFLNDDDCKPVAFSPTGRDIVALRREKIVLAHPDGSAWREITLVLPSSARMRREAEPWLAWLRDPSAADAVRMVRKTLTLRADQDRRNSEWMSIPYLDFTQLYKSLTPQQRSYMQGPGRVSELPCRVLSARQMHLLKRGMITTAIHAYYASAFHKPSPEEVDLSQMPPYRGLPDLPELRDVKVYFTTVGYGPLRACFFEGQHSYWPW